MRKKIEKLQFAFSATAREAEIINFVLGQGINALKDKETRDAHGITAVEVHDVENIRHKLVDQLLNPV